MGAMAVTETPAKPVRERWTAQWLELFDEVVTSGLCTGCAACVIACPHDVIGYNHVEGGYLRDRDGAPLETPEERDVFRALKVDFVEPRERTGQHMVRRAGRPQFPRRESQGAR